jgi:hypothetical protein
MSVDKFQQEGLLRHVQELYQFAEDHLCLVQIEPQFQIKQKTSDPKDKYGGQGQNLI